MEETKKSPSDHGGNHKMVIKLGGGAGVVGAVVLLGGALATAAFASAFVLGQKRRNSDKDSRGRRQNSSLGMDEKSEQEHEHISKGAGEEVELEKDSTVMISAHSLKVDVETISDEGFVMVTPSSEIPLLAEKEEKDRVELTKEDVSDDYSRESTNLEQVHIEDECDGEIDTTGRAEVTQMQPSEEDNGVEGKQIDDEHSNMELNMEKKKEVVVFCNGNGEINEEKAINGCIVQPSPENIPPLQFDAKKHVEKEELEDVKHGENEELNENEALVQPDEDDVKREEGEQELVDHGDGKATMSDTVNGEVPSKDVDAETSLVHPSAAMDMDDMDYGLDRKGVSSKWEALWQAEWPKAPPQKVELMSYEVGGKVREDETVVNKYAVEMGMLKDDQASSTRLRMMVWTVSVLSSLSCSWFFELSVAKLCLVVFLTVFLLEIYGYPLLNRQCLHGAKGESSKLADM